MFGSYAVDSEGHPRQNVFIEIWQRSWKQSSEWLPRECGKRYVFAEISQFLVSPWPVPHLTKSVYQMEDLHGRYEKKEASQELFFSLLYPAIHFRNIWNWKPIYRNLSCKNTEVSLGYNSPLCCLTCLKKSLDKKSPVLSLCFISKEAFPVAGELEIWRIFSCR